MLPISGKMKRLNDECLRAQTVLSEVIVALSYVKPDSNLTQEIGCFLTSSRYGDFRFAILKDDVHDIATLLRKVCTGEVSPVEALQICSNALTEINIISRGIESMIAEAKDKLFNP